MPRGKRKASDMDGEEEADETPRKMSKRERLAAARARAAASMAEDKRKVEAIRAKKEGRSIPEEPSSAKKKARSTPVKQTPTTSSPRKKKQTPQSDEEMYDAVAEDVKPAAAIKRSAVKIQPTYATSSIKSPPRYASRTSPVVVAPPPAPQVDDEDEDDDDEDMPPPPMPTLEAQISQQVFANMAAAEENKPTPHTQPPPEAFVNAPPETDEDDAEEFVHDDNPIIIDEEYPEEKSSTCFKMRKLILLALGVIGLFVFLQEDSVGEPGGADASVKPPCFKDNVILYQDTGIVNSCADNEGVECPDGGTCRLGELVECISNHYEISENKDNCVLTAQSKEKVAAIQAVLEEMTLQGGCHISEDGYPSFPYKDVQLANPIVIATDALELSILENEFNVQRDNGVLSIGLKSDFKIKLPLHCKLSSALAYIFNICGNFMVAAFHFLLSVVFSMVLELFKEYPTYSALGVFVFFVFLRIRQYRSYRKRLANDVSEIRQIAYDYLEDAPEQSHLVLHVRDHIVMNIYPKSKRNYLIRDVWPRVVPDFKADNRIRKTTRIVEGRPRDAWQWVAAVSAKKKPQTIQ